MQVSTLIYRLKTGWSSPIPQWDSLSTLVLAFASPRMASDGKWLQDLCLTFPNSKIVGCSTAGEIFGSQIEDHSVAVAVVKFAKTQISMTSVAIKTAEESFQVGQKIAQALQEPHLKGVFILSDGLKINGSELVRGVNSKIADSVVVTGGLAGDGSEFKKTWIISNGKICSDQIVAVGLSGDKIQIGHGSRGGWDIFGPERMVTRSKSNVLYELDGEPALDLYKKYLGDRAKDLPASGLLFPLQIRESSNSETTLVRTILGVDENEKSLTFAGDIPEGWTAQLMRANFDRLIDGASGAATQTIESIESDGPVLAIAVSCVGRRLILQGRAEEEVEATLEKLPSGTQQIGFYSYGEISPSSKVLNCELHNQTMTLTTISEVA